MVAAQLSEFDPLVLKELEDKSRGKLAELNKSGRVIGEEIFKILDQTALLIQYPIDDDELCGFVCKKDNRIFAFVNSAIPLEKQMFAAAHELYHIWYDEAALLAGEMVKSDTLETLDINGVETKANRFAAMFLVQKQLVHAELGNLAVDKAEQLELSHIVRLMDVFGVPYKTIVRRLFEINFIGREQCEKLLMIPDRQETTGVRLMQKRLQIGERWQYRTKTIRFGNLVDQALQAYEKKSIPLERLHYLLAMARKTPAEFGIETEYSGPNDAELQQILDETED